MALCEGDGRLGAEIHIGFVDDDGSVRVAQGQCFDLLEREGQARIGIGICNNYAATWAVIGVDVDLIVVIQRKLFERLFEQAAIDG